MLNQIALVGYLDQELKAEESDNERKVFYSTIAVPRNIKNKNSEHDTDYIPVVLTDGIGKNVFDYCKKGDILGIKGKIESIKENDTYNVRIVAERVTFLSTNKELLNQN